MSPDLFSVCHRQKGHVGHKNNNNNNNNNINKY